VSAHYTYLHATFSSGETVGGAGNSSADADGNIAIRPGDRLPLMPRRVFKARAEWQITPAWSAELGVLAVSDAMARGNENGLHRPDGMAYLGRGATPGHAVFDVGTAFQATPRLRVFAQVDNLTGRRYATASQRGTTGFDADGAFAAQDRVHSTFYAPGVPRTVRVGVRYTFD